MLGGWDYTCLSKNTMEIYGDYIARGWAMTTVFLICYLYCSHPEVDRTWNFQTCSHSQSNVVATLHLIRKISKGIRE